MTITASANKTPGVKHFQVLGDSGAAYVVTHVRRAGMRFWSCTCPDHTFRRQHKGSHSYCKHIRATVNAQHSGDFKNLKMVAA